MERKTITIEEIEANPNLDLSARMQMFSKNKELSSEDITDLAIASIKAEYEYMVNNVTDIPDMDEFLQGILNGHIYSQSELLQLMTTDSKQREEIMKYNEIERNVKNNNGITNNDLNKLFDDMGIDGEFKELTQAGFEDKELIINSFNKDNSHHK